MSTHEGRYHIIEGSAMSVQGSSSVLSCFDVTGRARWREQGTDSCQCVSLSHVSIPQGSDRPLRGYLWEHISDTARYVLLHWNRKQFLLSESLFFTFLFLFVSSFLCLTFAVLLSFPKKLWYFLKIQQRPIPSTSFAFIHNRSFITRYITYTVDKILLYRVIQIYSKVKYGHAGDKVKGRYSLLILNLVTRWGEWSESCPDRAVPPTGIHWIGGWVGFRAGLDKKVREYILCLRLGSNPCRPVCRQILYWLSYPSSFKALAQYLQRL
jgi:hypothetical protein